MVESTFIARGRSAGGRRARGTWLACGGLLMLATACGADVTLQARHGASTITWEIGGISTAVKDESASTDVAHVYRALYPPLGTPMSMRATFETDYQWAASRIFMLVGSYGQWARTVAQCPDNPDLGTCPPADISLPATLRLEDTFDAGSFKDPVATLAYAGFDDWYTLSLELRRATNVVVETLELTHPAGESPMVFTGGWLFGARCVVSLDGQPLDLSDRVTWSGTGTFTPGQGARSSPCFNAEGPNTIVLRFDAPEMGLSTSVSYQVEALCPILNDFACVGAEVYCRADAHGCPACPHPTDGRIAHGSPHVTVGGQPAARVGDGGGHAACCRGNMLLDQHFIVMEGDPRVLIDGRPAVRRGHKTRHCGGIGTVTGTGYAGTGICGSPP